jgi:P-type Ca2+ transporter type 2C
VWYASLASVAVRDLEVDPQVGLTAAEARRRLAEVGPNQLAEAPREPRRRAFLRQLKGLMITILLVAAVVGLLVSREWATPITIAVVVVLNATIGFVQESRAEASLDALRKMSTTTATVRRDGRAARVDAVELEAGDRVQADGRLLSAASLEVQDSALTGEAHPAPKSATAQVEDGAPLGDRTTAVYMNTSATRGHGEILVTATGMGTETGRIADILTGSKAEPTPLQRQISGLARTLAAIAGVVIVIVLGLVLGRGQSFADLFVTAVSLAVAAVPEGLPAIVTFT